MEFTRTYLEDIGFKKINGRTYIKGFIKIKLFYQGQNGDYLMMALTSTNKLYPKVEFRIPPTTKDFDKLLADYTSTDYSLNQFHVKAILLDKGEDMPLTGMISCNIEIVDRGGSHSVIPIEFPRLLHSKLHYIDEQSDVDLTFKIVSVFAKNKYIPKLVAIDVK